MHAARPVSRWFLIAAMTFGMVGCSSYPFISTETIVGGDTATGGTTPTSTSAASFTEVPIQARTFVDGTSVTTTTTRAGDAARTPIGIDFNLDGKMDPVIGYGGDEGVVQILLSRGAPGTFDFDSLTLDSKRDMQNLADVTVGDVDGDGLLDIVTGAKYSVWYFHHPSNGVTTDLRLWGNQNPTDPLRERVDASFSQLTDSELQAIITNALGPGVNLDDYDVTIEQVYTNVEIADFDNDGANDIAASRKFKITLDPKPNTNVEPIEINDGDIFVFKNPGAAIDGNGWTAISIGGHERQQRLDRDGATGLLLYDMNGDGWLDIVSSARDDNNVQVAWFANPGVLDANTPWTQCRIGSIRDAFAIDIGDINGDGLLDVVGTGGAQKQMMLFLQPSAADGGPCRGYDWSSYVIATFDEFEPRSVKIFDIDNDGLAELIVGGTDGALRYFDRPIDVTKAWTSKTITTFDPPGEVGLLGYGDFDADGDFDLISVINSDDNNEDRVIWIRNDVGVPAILQ
ncbi:MAG: VCBS repeat-containing protein [Phycisphaerae bacterium]